MYMQEMGTKPPSLLHSHPWAALSAAPSEAESVPKTSAILTHPWLHYEFVRLRQNERELSCHTGSLNCKDRTAKDLCN
jgi:hypothetical protein